MGFKKFWCILWCSLVVHFDVYNLSGNGVDAVKCYKSGGGGKKVVVQGGEMECSSGCSTLLAYGYVPGVPFAEQTFSSRACKEHIQTCADYKKKAKDAIKEATSQLPVGQLPEAMYGCDIISCNTDLCNSKAYSDEEIKKAVQHKMESVDLGKGSGFEKPANSRSTSSKVNKCILIICLIVVIISQ